MSAAPSKLERSVVEVVVSWDDAVLAVRYLRAGERFDLGVSTAGADGETEYFVGEIPAEMNSWPLVTAGVGEAFVLVPRGGERVYQRDIAGDEGASRRVTAPEGERVRLSVEDTLWCSFASLTVSVRWVEGESVERAVFVRDKTFALTVCAVAALLGLFGASVFRAASWTSPVLAPATEARRYESFAALVQSQQRMEEAPGSARRAPQRAVVPRAPTIDHELFAARRHRVLRQGVSPLGPGWLFEGPADPAVLQYGMFQSRPSSDPVYSWGSGYPMLDSFGFISDDPDRERVAWRPQVPWGTPVRLVVRGVDGLELLDPNATQAQSSQPGLPEISVRRAFAAHAQEIEGCLRGVSVNAPDAERVLSFWLVIAANGSVDDVGARSSVSDHDRVEPCISAVVRRFRFDPPRTETSAQYALSLAVERADR